MSVKIPGVMGGVAGGRRRGGVAMSRGRVQAAVDLADGWSVVCPPMDAARARTVFHTRFRWGSLITLDFKAELRDPDLARIIAKHHRGCFVVALAQKDQYFRLPEGKLVRRTSPGEPIEWIHSIREKRARPTMSHFQIYDEHRALEKWGTLMRPWISVEKQREIIMLDEATVKLDRVEALGWYFEASVLVTPKQNLARCYETIGRLRHWFAMALGEAVAGSYADLVVAAKDTKGAGEIV